MKLTEQLIDELCDWVSKDVPFRYCCDGCGVLYNTYLKWMSTGEEDFENEADTIYAHLFHRIKKTYAQVVRDSVAKIKSGDKAWTSEAWIRQRRDNEFMDKQEINTDGGQVIVQLGSRNGKHDNAK